MTPTIKEYSSISRAIKACKDHLVVAGTTHQGNSWQSTTPLDKMVEVLGISFRAPVPSNINELVIQCQPNLPWADEHFLERVSGKPLNPPPSHVRWPFGVRANAKHVKDEQFSHTYPERIWPKHVAHKHLSLHGIRYEYGDLDDVINLLKDQKHTRKAFLPIWFPEDTGPLGGQRVPCTLGYLFQVKNGRMDITYYIRSCDVIRHFRDDIYMAVRLLYHVMGRVGKRLRPGHINMHIANLHCFQGDFEVYDNY